MPQDQEHDEFTELFERSKNDHESKMIVGSEVRVVIGTVRDERAATKAVLQEWGICPTCKEEIKHHEDEPFASCNCGTREWTGKGSRLQNLRRTIKDAVNRFNRELKINRLLRDRPDMGDRAARVDVLIKQNEELMAYATRWQKVAMKHYPENWACDLGNPELTMDNIVRGNKKADKWDSLCALLKEGLNRSVEFIDVLTMILNTLRKNRDLRAEVNAWRDWYSNCKADLDKECTCDDRNRVTLLLKAKADTDRSAALFEE